MKAVKTSKGWKVSKAQMAPRALTSPRLIGVLRGEIPIEIPSEVPPPPPPTNIPPPNEQLPPVEIPQIPYHVIALGGKTDLSRSLRRHNEKPAAELVARVKAIRQAAPTERVALIRELLRHLRERR